VVLAVALAVVGWVAHERHQRVRRRLAQLERAHAESLLLLKPLYARAAAASLPAPPRMPIEFRSQFGEDLWLYNLFDGRTDGFYVECGAFDGYTHSISYAFEALGWTGLLVEPIPERFEACRARRPASTVVHAALSRRGSRGQATFAHLLSAVRHYETSSYLPGDAQRRRFRRPPKLPVRHVSVPLTTMDDLLASHAGPIDFVVLDVEGAEMDVLDGFDLDRFRPRAMLIEDHAMGRDPTLADALAARGYEHVAWIAYNRLFLRRDEPALLARARAIAQEGPAGGAPLS
jgi:FkbM family methyltransferase